MRTIEAEKQLILKKELCGQLVALTTDTWTSIHNQTYDALTVHLIDNDIKMQSFGAECVRHQGRTTSKALVSLFVAPVFYVFSFFSRIWAKG